MTDPYQTNEPDYFRLNLAVVIIAMVATIVILGIAGYSNKKHKLLCEATPALEECKK